MKPNLSWSYRIQGVAEAPADPTLHTFTVPGHKISAMAMGSSHFSREMENQWKSARLLDIVGYDTLEIFYDFHWFSQRVSQVSWWVEMSEPRRCFVLLYLLWCARWLQQTAIISSTRSQYEGTQEWTLRFKHENRCRRPTLWRWLVWTPLLGTGQRHADRIWQMSCPGGVLCHVFCQICQICQARWPIVVSIGSPTSTSSDGTLAIWPQDLATPSVVDEDVF
jgi:hypothetical protein